MQQLYAFRRDHIAEQIYAGQIGIGPAEIADEATVNGVTAAHEHDRDRSGRCLGSQ